MREFELSVFTPPIPSLKHVGERYNPGDYIDFETGRLRMDNILAQDKPEQTRIGLMLGPIGYGNSLPLPVDPKIIQNSQSH